MALTRTQQELIGAYGAVTPVQTPFWNLFTNSKTPYLALSNTIRVDEVVAGLTKAGVVPRGTVLPPIKVGGYSQVTVTPDIVGGSVGLSALDSINADAGEVVVLNGQQIKAKDYDRTMKIVELRNSIENTKEDLGAMAFIKGKVKDANGVEVDLGLPSEASKTKGKVKWVIALTNLLRDYRKETKKYPDRIVIGAKIADGIIAEMNASEKSTFGSDIKLENGALKIMINGFALPIETYPFNDIEEDTDTKVTLYKDVCLVPCYAGLEYIDTNGNPAMIRSDILVDKTTPNQETGQVKMFGKSAPFPLIILPELFRRYNFTDLNS